MIAIRRATPADKDAAGVVRTLAIRGSCGSHYTQHEVEVWSSRPMPDDFADLILRTDHFVAEADGVVVGTGFLTRATSKIDAVFVLPQFQRRGVATMILAELEKVARQAGLPSLRLSATLNAVDFYKSVGYKVQGTGRHCSSAGLTLDCVEMEKSL